MDMGGCPSQSHQDTEGASLEHRKPELYTQPEGRQRLQHQNSTVLHPQTGPHQSPVPSHVFNPCMF